MLFQRVKKERKDSELKIPMTIGSLFPILLIGMIILLLGPTTLAQPPAIILDSNLEHVHINKNQPD